MFSRQQIPFVVVQPALANAPRRADPRTSKRRCSLRLPGLASLYCTAAAAYFFVRNTGQPCVLGGGLKP